MAVLTVKNLDENLVAALKQRARARGVNVEEEHRARVVVRSVVVAAGSSEQVGVTKLGRGVVYRQHRI